MTIETLPVWCLIFALLTWIVRGTLLSVWDRLREDDVKRKELALRKLELDSQLSKQRLSPRSRSGELPSASESSQVTQDWKA